MAKEAAVGAAFLVLAAAAGGGALAAGKVPEGQTVTERPRPAFDPLGVRLGAFVITPGLDIAAAYDDNVFATTANKDDDLIAIVHPSIEVKTDTANHALRLKGDGRIGRFATNESENYEDASFLAEGRLDVLRTTRLSARLGFDRSHEDRASPDEAGGKEPVTFTVARTMVAGEHVFNRLGLRLEGRYERFDFNDARTAAGVEVNQDDRDRDVYAASLRAGYELAPEYEGFVRLTYNLRDYDAARDDDGVNRDSQGFEVAVGASADFTGVTFGELFAGYLAQDFDDPALATVEGFGFGAAVTWNPTMLTTVKLGARRTVKETTLVGAAGILRSEFALSVDHELLRALLLHAEIGLVNDDFEGIARDDDLWRFAFGGKYMMGRNVALAADYRFRRRNSNVAGGDFDRNLFTVRLELRY